uniref:Uncharacterized protein n=1 Tax=Sphaerodactylus townsendi TaxID=933632 RepID=A0ACB8G7R0_9SAUR
MRSPGGESQLTSCLQTAATPRDLPSNELSLLVRRHPCLLHIGGKVPTNQRWSGAVLSLFLKLPRGGARESYKWRCLVRDFPFPAWSARGGFLIRPSSVPGFCKYLDLSSHNKCGIPRQGGKRPLKKMSPD